MLSRAQQRYLAPFREWFAATFPVEEIVPSPFGFVAAFVTGETAYVSFTSDGGFPQQPILTIAVFNGPVYKENDGLVELVPVRSASAATIVADYCYAIYRTVESDALFVVVARPILAALAAFDHIDAARAEAVRAFNLDP